MLYQWQAGQDHKQWQEEVNPAGKTDDQQSQQVAGNQVGPVKVSSGQSSGQRFNADFWLCSTILCRLLQQVQYFLYSKWSIPYVSSAYLKNIKVLTSAHISWEELN